MSQRIVVVEDDPVSRKMLEFLLEEDGFEVVTCERGRDAHDQVLAALTDLVILDVQLPDMDGTTLALELQARGYDRPLIFVSGRGTIEDKVRGYDVGADDYLVKPFDPRELVARVHAVLRRYVANESASLELVVRVRDAELSIGTMTYRSAECDPVTLTPTEMQLLEILMRNQRMTISRERLTERVWGYDLLGDSNRVDVYVRRVRNKIEADPVNPQYLHTVRGVGYVFRPPDRPTGTAGTDNDQLERMSASQLPMHSVAETLSFELR
jgi:two-component system, OmpR family, response regulator RegX3